MKKFLKGFIALSLGLAMVGCAKEYDDTALKSKVDELSSDVNTLKAQQKAMQAVIDVWKAGGYIASIDDSVPGQHTITFYGDNGKVVVLYDGEDGEDGAPGAPGADGEDGADGDAFFKSVVTTEDGVTFTLSDDTSFTIPFAKAFKLVIETPEAEVEAGVDVEFPYTVNNANETTTVDVFAGGNYVAAVNATDKKIVVTPPTPAVNGSVLAWAQNEEGLFSMKKLSFIVKANTEVKTTQEELEAIPGEAGDFVVNVVSNIDIDVETPTVDWVSVAVTKADYKLTLTLAENTTGAPRETEIIVIRKDNGAQVQKIKIVQLVVDNTPMPDANPGDILWSEDWTVEKDGIMLDDYTFTGTKVFNDYKVKYSAVKPEGGSDIKVYLDTQMGGAAQGNLLLSKKGGTWTISGIPSGNATQAVLTFKTNAKDRLDGVTSDTEGVTMGEMVAPTEKSKPYSYAYDITLAAGVTKFNLTFTCNNDSNVRLDDIVLKVPEAAEKVLTVERVWGLYNSTSDVDWFKDIEASGTKLAATTDRNIAMDDDYIYFAKSSSYPAIIAVDKNAPTDATKAKKLNIDGIAGGTHNVSCVRVVKNTDASVNGGKDILLVSNLKGDYELKVYAYLNGIDAAPTQVLIWQWDNHANASDWRRYGDKFTVTGTWQSGAIWFHGWNDGKSLYFPVKDGAIDKPNEVSHVIDATASAIKDIAVYPGQETEVLVTSFNKAAFWTNSGTKNANNWVIWTEGSAMESLKNSYGYNFFEFNAKKYIAYTLVEDTKHSRLQVMEDSGAFKASLDAKTGLIEFPLQHATEFTTASPAEGGNNGDCVVRVIGEEAFILAMHTDGGLSLFKMYLK